MSIKEFKVELPDDLSTLDTKETVKLISTILNVAESVLTIAEQVSEKTNVPFSWSGPVYGMGGFYNPKSSEYSSSDEEDGYYDSDYGWQSSNNC